MQRIATANAYDQLVNSSLRLQTLMFQQQKQMATGLKAEDFGDLATGSYLVQDLRNDMGRAGEFLKLAQSGKSEVNAMHAILKKMVDLVTRFKSEMAGALGTAVDHAHLKNSARSMMGELETLMNQTGPEGHYFGGSRTNEVPVKIFHAGYVVPTTTSGADYSYYRGNQQARNLPLDENLDAMITVNARHDSIEKAIRAMGVIAGLGAPDKGAYKHAFHLAGESIKGLSNLQADLSAIAVNAEARMDQHMDFQLRAEAMLTRLTKADIGETMANLNAANAQLQASYMTISKYSNMSLLDYLK